MKLRASIIILFIAFFMSAEASAQVDRRVGREQYKRSKNKNEKRDMVEESVNYLVKELTLDDFQKAAVNNILEEEREAITNFGKESKTMSRNEQKDKAMAISRRIYNKVLPLLSKTQAEKYTKIEDEKTF